MPLPIKQPPSQNVPLSLGDSSPSPAGKLSRHLISKPVVKSTQLSKYSLTPTSNLALHQTTPNHQATVAHIHLPCLRHIALSHHAFHFSLPSPTPSPLLCKPPSPYCQRKSSKPP